ncbi:hypothetical protein GWO13_11340 [Candidatus Bathyarchaeota archaeon]|nr:hypothetical protein [Candidatus Bathyarchaeota archaeon]
MGKKVRLSKKIKAIIKEAREAPWRAWKNEWEQVISGDELPELRKILQKLGGKITHDEWEYSYYEMPLNIIVRTKTQIANFE